MSLDFTKVTYVDGETVIGADNLNDMQDAILDLDDNKVEKEQGKGLSTNDYTDTDKDKVDDAYVVPEGGIPKSALADAVQTSLDNADTALQEDDLEDLTEEVDDLKSAKAPVIIDTASGAIASFEDGADGMPLKSLTVNIEPVQSGTGDPSPTNVRPISGWTGCKLLKTGQNLLCDKDYTDGTTAGVQYTKLSDGSYLATGTITGKSARYLIGGNLGRTFKPGKYQVSCDGVSSDGIRLTVAYVQSYGQSTRYIDITSPNIKYTFEIEPTGYIYSIYFRGETNETTVNTILKPLLMFQADTETGWVPYVGETYSITFPSPNPGTVYGGTLDVTSGVLVVDKVDLHAMLSAGTWAKNGTFWQLAWGSSLPALANLGILCDTYQNLTPSGSVTQDNIIGFLASGTTLRLRDNSLTTLAEVQAKLENIQAIFQIAEPIVYDLTADEITTLLGTNSIWADCGPVNVEYPADTKLYIQKINAPTDDDMTADTQIGNGKYFLIGNTLYLSTTTIPAGDTIIPGTNCQTTNLAEALNALNT